MASKTVRNVQAKSLSQRNLKFQIFSILTIFSQFHVRIPKESKSYTIGLQNQSRIKALVAPSHLYMFVFKCVSIAVIPKVCSADHQNHCSIASFFYFCRGPFFLKVTLRTSPRMPSWLMRPILKSNCLNKV
jgi:hypothetical protein